MLQTFEINKNNRIEIKTEDTGVYFKLIAKIRTKKYYRFDTMAAALKYKEEIFSRFAAHEKAKQERREQKKLDAIEFLSTLKVGDIFYSSWGYDQTNIDFYQLVGLKGKKAMFQQIGQKTTRTTGWCSEMVVADPETFIGESFQKIINGSWINLTSYSGMQKWDGRELNETSYA